MADDAGAHAPPEKPPRRRFGWRVLALVPVIILAAALALVWLNRERIASDLVADELTKRGVRASYEVESIGTRRAVLRNLVVGDPARPDLTVERATVLIRHRFGIPDIDEVRLVAPRLYGTYRNGTLSFGELDRLTQTDSEQPFELPDLSLAVEDGRALIDSDFGRLGLSLSGAGWLRGGFRGELGAVAPELQAGGCTASGATLYGAVSVINAQPGFDGPLRFGRLACEEQGVSVADGALELGLRAQRQLQGVEGEAELVLGAAEGPGAELASAAGELGFTWREGNLTARYQLAATAVETPQASLSRLELDGSLRARREFQRLELDARLTGSDVNFGSTVDSALANAESATGGTLLAPILRQVRGQWARQARGSTLVADVIGRRNEESWSLVVPEARLRGREGETLVALSRLQLALPPQGGPRYSGNLATSGTGLPRIAARVEQGARGMELRASMAPYSAGDAVLAVPTLTLLHATNGTIGFSGAIRASGPLPGGHAEGLELPLSGSWSRGAGLALWRDCMNLSFASLRFANLALDRRQLTLCPQRGEPILRAGPNGVQVAAGAPSLRLSGRLGETPIALESGPVGFAWPGTLTASGLNVVLGPADSATRFATNDLTARIGSEIGGTFAGTDVLLFAVPLDVRDASGNWRFADGRLELTDGTFRVEDRQTQPVPRFQPLIARGSTLMLADNVITAQAPLFEPESGRAVTRVNLRHYLATGTGFADLAVDGLLFDRGLQPVALSRLALGIVANVDGVVTGTGRIDWNEQSLTSSGTFSTNDLDFAAAFGPVAGASGTVHFTDLLGLTTAPGQVLRVQSVNPGIEINDGELRFNLRDGEVLAIEGGRWPFLGGTLTMHKLDIRFGEAEVRRYVFDIEGLEAALFVQRMQLDNLAATGTFDGTIPVVFDREGNGRLEGGFLVSQTPGGNVSYVGELTYEDLSPMANFAFDALRSLDYRQMRIQMDGPLTGEIVTRVRFDGVSQGEGAGSNFITRRLARLPLRFDVNIRAPFYSLIGSVRSLYDPTAVRDPRELGLVDQNGNAIRRETDGVPPPPPPPNVEAILQQLIQPSDSEETR